MLELRTCGHRAAECPNPPSAGKGAYGYKGKGKGDSKGKGKGKGECWNCGESGHRSYECKNPTKNGKGGGRGKDGWQQKWQSGIHSIYGLKESTVQAVVLDRCPGPQISSGSFACLQEDDEDEEEEAPGFQSQASIYAEKKQKQEEHAAKEEDHTNLPPPTFPQAWEPVKSRKKPKRLYKPMTETKDKSECGCTISSSKIGVEPAPCELEQNKSNHIMKDPNYLPDSFFTKNQPQWLQQALQQPQQMQQ